MSSRSSEIREDVALLGSFLETILERIGLAKNLGHCVRLIKSPLLECEKVSKRLSIICPLKLDYETNDSVERLVLDYFHDPYSLINAPPLELNRSRLRIISDLDDGAFDDSNLTKIKLAISEPCRLWIEFLERPEQFKLLFNYSASVNPEPSEMSLKKRGGRPRDRSVDEYGDIILEMANNGVDFPAIAKELDLDLAEVKRIKDAARRRAERK